MHSAEFASILAAEEHKLLACVHCGLCLEACPTYVLTGNENDGPRGRIYLMRGVVEGKLPADSSSFRLHIDRCLGCRACEPVCPAGVQYGQLLEASRAQLFTSSAKRGFSYTLLRVALRHLWLHPARLKFAFATARLLREAGMIRVFLKSRIPRLISRRFEFALAILEGSASRRPHNVSDQKGNGAGAHKRGAEPATATMLFKGCIGEGLFSRVNNATERVLGVNGFVVQAPANQACCGALHAHAGDLDGARILARKNIEAFNGAEVIPIITNAGGCGAMLTTYGHLLADDELFCERAEQFSARIHDISQQLEKVLVKEGAGLTGEAVTYDASCHLLYGQHATESPLKLLRAIPNLNLIPLDGAERCCGAAGVYNLLEPRMSQGVLKEKLCQIRKTGAAILVTGNPGCQMQISAGAQVEGIPLTVCHPVELLDESYRRAGFYEDQ